MTTMTITAKGQVTLRKELLRHLGIAPGDRIDVEKLPDGRLEMRAAHGKHDISKAFGMFGPPDRPAPTIEEINEAIAAGWAGER